MICKLEPGTYVLAVSGGVDSVSLLHALQPQIQRGEVVATVAHFNHGIRDDASADQAFVQRLAASYDVPFVTANGDLGKQASEATARTARYAFLRSVAEQAGARALVTAHHQDDVLETALLNLLRGTGRKGLSSLCEQDDLQRPLLRTSKATIIEYAAAHRLAWREDSTNTDTHYRRNYVRHKLLPQLSDSKRRELLRIIEAQHQVNLSLDQALNEQLQTRELDRQWFISLPHSLSREVMASWLRQHDLAAFDRQTIERLTIKAKVSRPGKRLDVYNNQVLHITKHHLALMGHER